MPYVHSMLSYFDVIVFLVLKYLMALFWFNVNRNLLLNLNLKPFSIIRIIAVQHALVLDYSKLVSQCTLLSRVSMSYISTISHMSKFSIASW